VISRLPPSDPILHVVLPCTTPIFPTLQALTLTSLDGTKGIAACRHVVCSLFGNERFKLQKSEGYLHCTHVSNSTKLLSSAPSESWEAAIAWETKGGAVL
jgi:hypothetical protein